MRPRTAMAAPETGVMTSSIILSMPAGWPYTVPGVRSVAHLTHAPHAPVADPERARRDAVRPRPALR